MEWEEAVEEENRRIRRLRLVAARLQADAVGRGLRIGAIVSRNGEVEETGLGAGVLNHPALGIAWLANRLAEYGDDGIEPGQIVLAGSFIRPIEASHGSTIQADFGPHGMVSVDFS